MAKNNTILFEIIQSELINMGRNEFTDGLNIVMNNDNFAFIKKTMRYDADVKEIVNKKFFHNCVLYAESADDHFKKCFCNLFLNRQISRQTVEDFSSILTYHFLINEEYINTIYKYYDNFLIGNTKEKIKGEDTSINDRRSLTSDLPRDNINLNVDDTILNYGNENTIDRNKSKNNKDSLVETMRFNVDDLQKCYSLLKVVFDEIDKNCFMQVF